KAKRTIEISQSSGPIPLVAVETVIKEWEDRMERAATTASSLEAEQDSGNINKSQSIATLNESFLRELAQSNDPPLSRVNTLGSGEDSMKLKELMDLCTKLPEKKPEESNGFEQIIDFLNASSIRYALTVNPTIYTSCLKQFWATAKVQTVNEEVQIQALVDGKKNWNTQKLTFYKAFFSPQWKFLIHIILQCLSAKTTTWNESSSTMASAIICLATNQIFNFSKYIIDNMVKNMEGGVKFLMYLRVLALENTNTSQAAEIVTLKDREDASKQGRKIADIDQDVEVVSAADPVTTAGEVVTTASVEIPEELTLAQNLIEIKSAKHKASTTASTTTTITRPKARGVAKDKGKAKMVEPEKPLKKKDQIAFDEEVARNLAAQLQVELEEEERLSRQKEEEANLALIESWKNTQSMMDADFQLAQQMQIEEQEHLSIEEKSKLFVELLEKRKKHFAALRAKEKRNQPPTKTQKRMSTYLKNMVGYKHNQLKSKSYDEIQEMFDKEMKRENTFVDIDTELVKGSKTKAKESSKRAREELESDNSKKQKIDEHVEAEGDDDQEETEMKKHMEIVQHNEVAIDAIPLNIDREDLETLWKLVKAKHRNTRPEEAYESVLWGDPNVMFEPDVESEIWRNLQVKQFRETLLQHMGNGKKLVVERTRHKRQYDIRVSKRQMQTHTSKVDSSKALDADLVAWKAMGQNLESRIQAAPTEQSEPIYDTYLLEKIDSNTTPDSTNISHSGGEIDQDAEQYQVKSPLFKAEFFKMKDMVEKEVYNELSNRFLQLETHCISLEISIQQKEETKNSTINNLKKQIKNVHEKSNEANVKHDTGVIETINIKLEHKVAKLLKKNETLKKHYKDLYDSIKVTRTKTIEQITSLIAKNDEFKAQLQEKGFTIIALKNELRKLKGNTVDTKFAKPSILGKLVLQPPRNQSIVRQPNAFKSKRPNFSKPRFASHVDVNNVLSKPVTPHYLPKVREYILVKPHYVIAPGLSRNSQEESYGSNDMAHNHYLKEARNKTQERNRNSKSSVMHTTSLQNTTNGSKQNPRSNNQTSRNLHVSKSSGVTSNSVLLVDHSRNSSSFSDSKHFVCSACQKCIFNANHDVCLTKFLKEVNSRIKVQSPKTRNNIKPIEMITKVIKPKRWISKGYRISPNKSSVVHEKPNTPRSCLRWKPTGRIFKNVLLDSISLNIRLDNIFND
ncbi:hypothetical protein Tco_0863095, partial [Tanacetum coccineum]